MRLQANWYLDTAMGVAADIDTRKIQGRGVFLHSRDITNEKTKKGTKNAYDRPRRMDAVMIPAPRTYAVTHDLLCPPLTSGVVAGSLTATGPHMLGSVCLLRTP